MRQREVKPPGRERASLSPVGPSALSIGRSGRDVGVQQPCNRARRSGPNRPEAARNLVSRNPDSIELFSSGGPRMAALAAAAPVAQRRTEGRAAYAALQCLHLPWNASTISANDSLWARWRRRVRPRNIECGLRSTEAASASSNILEAILGVHGQGAAADHRTDANRIVSASALRLRAGS
jgi:hypothetical protein